MSEEKSGKPETDPMAAWKQMRDVWLDSWAKTMGETVASQDFARAMGQYMDTYFGIAGPVRKQIEEMTERYLQQMSLPTRGEVISLAQRLTHIEMRLDDLDAKADEILDRLKAMQAAPVSPAKPKRAARRRKEASP